MSRTNSPIKDIEINAPTREKKLIPYSNGPNDKIEAMQREAFANDNIRGLLVNKYTTNNARITHVASAVRSGAKFAYPNGVKSK